MDILAELLAEGMFPDKITIEPTTGSDAYGTKTYGASYIVDARIVGRVKIVADQDGKESVSSVQATLAGSFNVSAADRFTLPARFSSNPTDPDEIIARQPQALAVDQTSDENGPHHEVVYFSNARQRTF